MSWSEVVVHHVVFVPSRAVVALDPCLTALHARWPALVLSRPRSAHVDHEPARARVKPTPSLDLRKELSVGPP